MRSEILPAEHVLALVVNSVVLVMAVSSLGLLVPRFLDQSAKVTLVNREVSQARARVQALEGKIRQVRGGPQGTARAQANLVPSSRVSIILGK